MSPGSAPAQLRQLVALKVRLTYRLYQRNPWALLGWLLYLGFMSFLSFGGLFTCLLLLEVLREPQRTELLYLMLAGLYLLWVASPLLGVSLNESYDLSKLFVYPIPYSRVFLGSVLSNLLDPAVLLLAPVLTAPLIAFGPGLPQMVANAGLLLLFVVHTVSLSQALQLVMWGFLRSRRVRDLVLVLGPLLSVLIYLGQLMLFRRKSWATIGWMASLWESEPSQVLKFAPCGVVATGLQAVSRGDWTTVLLSALLLLLLCALTLLAAAWLIRQFHAGESEFGRLWVGRGRVTLSTRESRPTRRRWPPLPPAVRAVALKEFRYVVRDPHWKAYLIRSLAPTILYPLVMIGVNPRGGRPEAAATLEVAMFTVPAGALLFSTLLLNANIFAIDRQGLNLLFQFSCPRRLLFLGKNVATFSLIGAVAAGLLLLIGVLTRRFDLFAISLVGTLSLMLIFLGAGNLLSVAFPHRLPSKHEPQMQTSTGRGCLMFVVHSVAYFLVVAVATPPLLALVLPYSLDRMTAYWMTLPAVALYCLALYAGSVVCAGGWLQRREPDLLQAVRGE